MESLICCFEIQPPWAILVSMEYLDACLGFNDHSFYGKWVYGLSKTKLKQFLFFFLEIFICLLSKPVVTQDVCFGNP